MSQLHLINQSPFASQSIQDALPLILKDDTVLLFNDGVYAALRDTPIKNALEETGAKLLMLDTDAQARGIQSEHINTVSMTVFVELSLSAKHVISWF